MWWPSPKRSPQPGKRHPPSRISRAGPVEEEVLLIVGVPGQEVGLKGLHQAVEKVAVGHRAAERRPVLSLTKGAGRDGGVPPRK